MVMLEPVWLEATATQAGNQPSPARHQFKAAAGTRYYLR
jgi:hypothetical protein